MYQKINKYCKDSINQIDSFGDIKPKHIIVNDDNGVEIVNDINHLLNRLNYNLREIEKICNKNIKKENPNGK